MKNWEDGFQPFQPNIKFETRLPGTEAALAGLYGNIADVVFIGREVYTPERNGFRGRFGYDPLEIQISSGSFATPHKTFSLQVFVHQNNPITKLTLQQVDAVFGCELRRGAKEPIRKWAQLGLAGTWTNQPIHVYGYNFDTGMAGYFRRVVLMDSPKWNDQLKDFDNGREPNGEVINAGVYILQALAKDPYGIAFANVLYANPSVKALALASESGQPYYEPTKENVWLRKYPISRFTTLAINRPPGQPVNPKVKEFVRYILSKEGMAAVVRDGSYLPLTQELIDKQLNKLE
ncbi:MAG: substrate-binding domain-containing protein [Acidobacteriaceae bacterium]|nr:substrate-binding domain-containing protein [Acidobacteriaceae bacterium]